MTVENTVFLDITSYHSVTSNCYVATYHLHLLWRWSQQVPLKQWHISTRLQSITTKTTVFFCSVATKSKTVVLLLCAPVWKQHKWARELHYCVQICDQDGLPCSISTVPSAQTICLLGHYDNLQACCLDRRLTRLPDVGTHVWDIRQNSMPLHVPQNMLIIWESSSTLIYSPFRIPLEYGGTTVESQTFWLDEMH